MRDHGGKAGAAGWTAGVFLLSLCALGLGLAPSAHDEQRREDASRPARIQRIELHDLAANFTPLPLLRDDDLLWTAAQNACPACTAQAKKCNAPCRGLPPSASRASCHNLCLQEFSNCVAKCGKAGKKQKQSLDQTMPQSATDMAGTQPPDIRMFSLTANASAR